jgi:galactokinase
MWRVADNGVERGASAQLADALAWLDKRGDFFDATKPIALARAPGRLDLMGGIADYSGSLVLELPLAAATWVAAQPSDAPTVIIESSEGTVTIPLCELVREPPLDYAQAHALLTEDRNRAWSAYVAGALVVLQRERGLKLSHGLKLMVRSEVAIGKGISSSAALEVAALEALSALEGIALADRDLAMLAQKVENAVVGAPCGVMDQMTVACGKRDHLLELLCQPAEIIGQLAIPGGLEVLGIDSGIRHAVSGADYGTVRAAAFMGYRIVADLAGLAVRPSRPDRVTVDDPMFGGYLANVSPSVWRERFRESVPERLSGRAFLKRYQGSTDDATMIDPDRIYPVRVATEHPIEEHDRVRRFRELLATGATSDESRVALGALMYASHASYSACGLGSEGTDQLVALCRAAGPHEGLYGAKITGGGSGGTVAVLAAKGSPSRGAVERIAERYRAATGRDAVIFSGSSDGAHRFGVRTLMHAG